MKIFNMDWLCERERKENLCFSERTSFPPFPLLFIGRPFVKPFWIHTPLPIGWSAFLPDLWLAALGKTHSERDEAILRTRQKWVDGGWWWWRRQGREKMLFTVMVFVGFESTYLSVCLSVGLASILPASNLFSRCYFLPMFTDAFWDMFTG